MIYDQNDLESLALCAWKEARGDGQSAMDAVQHVIKNRVGFLGFARTIHDVIYGRNQFSSMSVPSDPEFNLQPAVGDPQYAFAFQNASNVLSGAPDSTDGAHYYANLATANSGWFKTYIVDDPVHHPKTVQIGKQTFFV